ncbi:MAG: 50S ribosomal protein L6 [Alphaproteobacteria bacterium]|nr:50S ribosomal protein L6 [Alphaproteobacteria bacterium]
MSRIGNKPVTIPKGVTISVASGAVTVKGPKGELSESIHPSIEVEVGEAEVVFKRKSEVRTARAAHGLMRSLTQNMVVGVTEGFSRRLEVQGVGYRADVRGQNLVLNLGYSHLVEFPIPQGVQIAVDKDNKITVSGIDKQRVGQVAANIRKFRTPDRYKGKGVRYEGETILLKAGKSA